MREIKFRGQRVDNGEWVYGNFVSPCYIIEKLIYVSSMQFIANTPTKSIEGVIHEINPKTIGQFTGLLDKNGKEIYEGDIIKSYANLGYGKKQKQVEIISEVIYFVDNKKTMSGLDCNSDSKFITKQINKQDYTNLDWSMFFNCEVTGTIHDKEMDNE